MSNYIIAYHGGRTPKSPEEGAKQRANWQSWIDGLGDAVVNPGGSGGARVSLLAAARNPDVTAGLAMWWISGGVPGLLQLANYYCMPSADAAWHGGMEAVVELEQRNAPVGVSRQELRSARLTLQDVEMDALEIAAELREQQPHLVRVPRFPVVVEPHPSSWRYTQECSARRAVASCGEVAPTPRHSCDPEAPI